MQQLILGILRDLILQQRDSGSLSGGPPLLCVKTDFLRRFFLKGSLHTTVFSKYKEVLQLKNIFRIF